MYCTIKSRLETLFHVIFEVYVYMICILCILLTGRSALKMIRPYLIETITYDACPNDCILFRGSHSNRIDCPTCAAKRYKKDKIPQRSFVYMPLGPRFERMFATSNISQIVQCHASESHSEA